MTIPRAPTIVPKLTSSIFTAPQGGHHATAQPAHGYYEVNTRGTSQMPGYTKEANSSRGLGAYGDHLTLPPIHSFQAGGQGPTSQPRTYRSGASRPSHQRSASAFTPVSRSISGFDRPNSSGYGDPIGYHTLETSILGASMHGRPAQGPDAYGPPSGPPQSFRHHHHSSSWSQNYQPGSSLFSFHPQGPAPGNLAADAMAPRAPGTASMVPDSIPHAR
jgi:hypothetical protein